LLLCNCGNSELSGGERISAGGFLGVRVVSDRQVGMRNTVCGWRIVKLFKKSKVRDEHRRLSQIPAAARAIPPHLEQPWNFGTL
jgi:hypothetical protein